MPMYEYRCRDCNATVHSTRHGLQSEEPCYHCQGPLRRVYSISFHRDIPEHFNKSLGKVVSGGRDLKSKLTEAAAKQTERTGIPHSYVPLSAAEAIANAPAAEREALAKEKRDRGEQPSKALTAGL